MRKLLSILGALGLTASASAAVVSCGYPGGFFFLGKSLLSDVIDIDLGTYTQDPSEELLKNSALKKNPEVVGNEVVLEKTSSAAIPGPQRDEPFKVLLKVKDNSRYYSQDFVWMTYRIDRRTSLDQIITDPYLGSFDKVLTPELVKAKLNSIYQGKPDFYIDQIEVQNITGSTVKIVPTKDSEDYVLDSSVTLNFDYGKLMSLRAILENEKPLEPFHTDIAGVTSKTVMDEMKRAYEDIKWEEIEQLDDSKFNQNIIIFKVKKDSTVYVQDTVEVSFDVYKRVLVDSVIDDHNLKDLILTRSPEFNDTNLDKLLNVIASLNPRFKKEGIVFDHVTKADDFNGISENSVTFRASSKSIWYIYDSTFTITYKRDFHGWNRFVPAGDLSNNFVNIMELTPEEFSKENEEILKSYQQQRDNDSLKWEAYDNLLRIVKSPGDTDQKFNRVIRDEIQKFGPDNFKKFTLNYLRYITAQLKAIEADSPNATGKKSLQNFYYLILWGGRGVDDFEPNPGRLMGFVNAGALDEKTALWINNLNDYAQNWLTNWGSPVRPN